MPNQAHSSEWVLLYQLNNGDLTMAHFYGTLSGSGRTESTRCGHKSTGLTATANGWDIGGKIELHYNPITQQNEVSFYITSGSNKNSRKLFTITEEELDQCFNSDSFLLLLENRT